MEFVYLVGVAFMIMIVFVAATRTEFDDLSNEEEKAMVKDVAVMLQHELVVASNVEDGYLRMFNVPLNLNRVNYSILTANNSAIVYTEDYEYTVNIPSIQGNFVKGNNIINKTNEIIKLN
jgi:hypothetical protein